MAASGRTYKIRKFQNGKNAAGDPFINYSLTIPTYIAERLPQDMKFACVLTDEGILFTPATRAEAQADMPAWAQAHSNGKPAQQKRTAKKK